MRGGPSLEMSLPKMVIWRAVDSEGEVLDILVQPRRDSALVGDARSACATSH